MHFEFSVITEGSLNVNLKSNFPCVVFLVTDAKSSSQLVIP